MWCGKQPQQSHFVLHTAPDTKSTRTGTANRGHTTANGAQSAQSAAQSATHVQEAIDIL